MDSTFIPDQNSTAVSNRGGLGASASAASTLSGQLSTAAVPNRGGLGASASAASTLSGQLSTAASS